jgi:pimeloyl-ACP methyl ester carboxylesterase
MIVTPQTRYARSPGDVRIAYQSFGEGDLDLVFVTGFVGNVEALWEEPVTIPFVERLGSFARVTAFDKRGQGLSDRPGDPPTLEQTMDDVLAVMDAAGLERAAIFAVSEGGPASLLFAATHPDRVSALVLYGTFARMVASDDYPFGISDDALSRFAELVDAQWGGPVAAHTFAPSVADDPQFRESWGRFLRRGSSPHGAASLIRMYRELDVRDVLPAISVPTLVLHRSDDRLTSIAGGRYIADRIPGARFVELPGADHLMIVEPDQILDEVEEFLTGERHVPVDDRVLATVLFTDIVGSTERAAELGDRRWRELVERHDELMRREIERHRGRTIKTLGDGVLATFDGPARAIRAAKAAAARIGELGLDVRAGLHTGEIELRGADVAGMAVNIGARVAGLAGAGEVLVSSTVKDLVYGSGIEFTERGEHRLKGVPGEWRLYAAEGG